MEGEFLCVLVAFNLLLSSLYKTRDSMSLVSSSTASSPSSSSSGGGDVHPRPRGIFGVSQASVDDQLSSSQQGRTIPSQVLWSPRTNNPLSLPSSALSSICSRSSSSTTEASPRLEQEPRGKGGWCSDRVEGEERRKRRGTEGGHGSLSTSPISCHTALSRSLKEEKLPSLHQSRYLHRHVAISESLPPASEQQEQQTPDENQAPRERRTSLPSSSSSSLDGSLHDAQLNMTTSNDLFPESRPDSSGGGRYQDRKTPLAGCFKEANPFGSSLLSSSSSSSLSSLPTYVKSLHHYHPFTSGDSSRSIAHKEKAVSGLISSSFSFSSSSPANRENHTRSPPIVDIELKARGSPMTPPLSSSFSTSSSSSSLFLSSSSSFSQSKPSECEGEKEGEKKLRSLGEDFSSGALKGDEISASCKAEDVVASPVLSTSGHTATHHLHTLSKSEKTVIPSTSLSSSSTSSYLSSSSSSRSLQEGQVPSLPSSSSSSSPGSVLPSGLSSSGLEKREELSAFGLASAIPEKEREGGEEGEREDKQKTGEKSAEEEEKDKREEKKECSTDQQEGLERGDNSCKTPEEEEHEKQEKETNAKENKKKEDLGDEEEDKNNNTSNIMGCSTDSRGHETRDILLPPPSSSYPRLTGEEEQAVLDARVEEKNCGEQEGREERMKKKKIGGGQKERPTKQHTDDDEEGHNRKRRMSGTTRKSRNLRHRKEKKIERMDELFAQEKGSRDDKEEEEDSACAYLQSLVRILAPEHRLSVNLSESVGSSSLSLFLSLLFLSFVLFSFSLSFSASRGVRMMCLLA